MVAYDESCGFFLGVEGHLTHSVPDQQFSVRACVPTFCTLFVNGKALFLIKLSLILRSSKKLS